MEADQPRVHRPLPAPLCVITDRHRAENVLPDVLRSAVDGGARWLRVREPDLALSAYATMCDVLIDAVSNERVTWSVRPSAYLLVRSRWPELRLGVHLTSTDEAWRAPDADVLIGRSVRANVVTAKHEQMDYRLLAPVFDTRCKPDAAPCGPGAVARLASLSSVPVIALGGVTPLNVDACMRAGAAGVAVCGGVMENEMPREAVAAYMRALEQQ